jgi:hypothetical protein
VSQPIAWGSLVPVAAAAQGEWRKLVLKEPRLSMAARVVGCVVAENVHMGRGRSAQRHLVGFAFKSELVIGSEVGVSERQVRRAIQELQTLGYIDVTARKVRLANGIRLRWPPLPFDRTNMAGKRKPRATRAQSPSTGQFRPDRPDNFGASDRSGLSRDSSEDLLEDSLEERHRIGHPGVSDDVLSQYRAALAGGSQSDLAAALRRLGDGQAKRSLPE